MKTRSEISTWFVITVCTLVIGSSLSCGYQYGIVTGPSVFIKDFYNQTHLERAGEPMSEYRVAWQWAGTVAVFSFGRIIGELVGGKWSERVGRSRGLMFNNALSIADSILLNSCRAARSPGLLIFGRCIMGFSVGISMTIVPVYLKEVSPFRLRYSVSKLHHVFFVSGILLGQIAGFLVFYNEFLWPASFGLPALIGLVQTVFLLRFCPETPTWLMHYKYAEEKAAGALRQLRGSEEVDQEILELRHEHATECRIVRASVWEVLFLGDSNWKMPLLTSLVLQAGRQLTGVSAIVLYSTEIFQLADMTDFQIAMATVIWAAVHTAATLVEYFSPIWRLGRRPVLLLSYGVLTASMLGVAFTLILQTYRPWLCWLSLACICTLFIAFSLGPALTTSVVCGELWSRGPREAALNLSHQVRWWSDVIIQLTFPILLITIGGYTFLIFAGSLLTLTLFIALYMSETRDRRLIEPSAAFATSLKELGEGECDEDGDEKEEKELDDEGEETNDNELNLTNLNQQ